MPTTAAQRIEQMQPTLDRATEHFEVELAIEFGRIDDRDLQGVRVHVRVSLHSNISSMPLSRLTPQLVSPLNGSMQPPRMVAGWAV